MGGLVTRTSSLQRILFVHSYYLTAPFVALALIAFAFGRSFLRS